ncbi:MAG TPA: hypothetical protein DD438_06580, partial [Verrucomicrobiales bacterium]|nr:hypothetical protein [Verrucomicrobiales bacterium]
MILFLVMGFRPQELQAEDSSQGTGGLDPDAWSFVSIPDFLNFDIEYPQKGWEEALGFILGSMKKESPAFAMVAGDLVMGHWGT